MHVYGLTGGIGSGKSAVASLLEEYGIPVVSADELSRMVVAKGSSSLQAVVDAFGPEVLSEDGELDRKAMAKIVFADPDRRRQLESILHPKIRERFAQVLEALEHAGHEVAVYEVPLLFEKKLQGDMHAVVLVTADAETRIARVMRRDEASRDQVLARMRTQMPEAEKRELANYLILNDGDLDDLRREVQLLISHFLKLDPNTQLQLLDTPVETRPSATEIHEDPLGGAPPASDTATLPGTETKPSSKLPQSKIDTIIQVPSESPSTPGASATLPGVPRVAPPPSSKSSPGDGSNSANTQIDAAIPPPPKLRG